MSRAIPSGLLVALAQPNVEPFYAIECLFDDDPLRLWTGYGDRVIGGQTYTGGGSLLTIGGLEEIADLSAKKADITLSGIASSLITAVFATPYQGRKVRILFGVRDVSDYIEVFTGFADQMTIRDSGETSDITLSVESKLVDLERPRVRRYTQESHASRYPTDTFFSFVADLQDKEIIFGRAGNNKYPRIGK